MNKEKEGKLKTTSNSYMELQLDMENSGPFIGSPPRTTKNSNKPLTYHYEIATVIALLIPLAFTTGHMLLFSYLYSGTKHVMDKKACTCSCWDTIFKGSCLLF